MDAEVGRRFRNLTFFNVT